MNDEQKRSARCHTWGVPADAEPPLKTTAGAWSGIAVGEHLAPDTIATGGFCAASDLSTASADTHAIRPELPRRRTTLLPALELLAERFVRLERVPLRALDRSEPAARRPPLKAEMHSTQTLYKSGFANQIIRQFFPEFAARTAPMSE